jgi:hypothetical protein
VASHWEFELLDAVHPYEAIAVLDVALDLLF